MTDINISETPSQIYHPSGAESQAFFDRFNEWRTTEAITDFTIIAADGKNYSVHKSLVAAWSDYVQMYALNENFNDDKTSVTLPAVPPEVCKALLVEFS